MSGSRQKPTRFLRLMRMQASALAVSACGVNILLSGGCGTTKSSQATEQLLLSDAVDRSVAAIDFRILSGKSIFVDTRYIEPPKERPNLNQQQWNFVNAPYAISSIRQQIMAAGCRLVDKAEEADIVVEPRIGTLASDAHQAVIGIPAATKLNTAAEFVPNAPSLPAIPELALARRETQDAAAKIAIFAYDRATREPIWQSGLSLAQSTARDTWIFGIGPYHRSAIREGNNLVSGKLDIERVKNVAANEASDRPDVDYDAAMLFDQGWPVGTGLPKRQAISKSAGENPANSDGISVTGELPTSTPPDNSLKPSAVVRASASEPMETDRPIRLPPP